ncbi:MAG: hypothetical protein RR821_10295 [Clostridia bacterium]
MNEPLSTQSTKQRTLTWLSWALMIFSPFLLMLLLSLILKENTFAANPVWTDELDYWRTLFNWQHVGFSSGYSGLFEALPASGTLGVHGFTVILLYGWFVKLFGLSLSTIVVCNLVWISLSAFVFCLIHKPKASIALFLTALLTVYVPIIMYCTTSMTELFNYALLLFYLTFLLGYHQRHSLWFLLGCVVTVVFGCLYRITYFLLFIPVALVFSRFRFGWKMVLSALVSLVLSVLCYLLTSATTAPYIQGFLYHLVRADSLGTFVQMLLSHTKANLYDYFIRATQSPMEVAFRLLYCAVMLLCLLGAFTSVQKTEKKLRLRFRFSGELLGCFLLLFTALGLIAMLYETNDWSDFRTLAPFLWLVLGYLAIRKQFFIPAAALAASLASLVLLCTLPPMGAYADETRYQPEPPKAAITQAAALIPYDPAATNPLTNTIRIDIPGLQVIQELQPGLGLQYGWFTTETTGLSRWILTDHLKCVVHGYEPVFAEDGVKLYRLIEPYEEAKP